jgi:hypothetical protein
MATIISKKTEEKIEVEEMIEVEEIFLSDIPFRSIDKPVLTIFAVLI